MVLRDLQWSGCVVEHANHRPDERIMHRE